MRTFRVEVVTAQLAQFIAKVGLVAVGGLGVRLGVLSCDTAEQQYTTRAANQPMARQNYDPKHPDVATFRLLNT